MPQQIKEIVFLIKYSFAKQEQVHGFCLRKRKEPETKLQTSIQIIMVKTKQKKKNYSISKYRTKKIK